MSQKPPWGQHFLRDQKIVNRIAQSVVHSPGSFVIEIGPGRGVLTRQLLARGARVTAIEIDPNLVTLLNKELGNNENFEVINANILDVDLNELIAHRTKESATIAGNLPYYITSPILKKVFDAEKKIVRAILLMQKEVASRVLATPNTSDYSFLSVLCGFHSEARYLFTVPARSFRPPPRVTSAVVELKFSNKNEPNPDFLNFVKVCFRHRRKILLNNLSSNYDRSHLSKLPGIHNRAQQLSIEDLYTLWETVKSL